MRVSLRWRLILVSWSLAFTIALVLSTLLHTLSERQLLGQLEKTLQGKCDEVITVLENPDPHLALEEFLAIETDYRLTTAAYYYQVRDGLGRTLARSENLGGAELPLPEVWPRGHSGIRVHLATGPDPTSAGEEMRVRSERIEIAMAGGTPAMVVIQTAISLGAHQAALRQSLNETVLVGAGGLAAIFFLLWFVTTRTLQPVSAMTRKASLITATNLKERLTVTGSEDELDELAKVLNDMLDRLAAALRQMEEFSSDAAHQLRAPLTHIRCELELILRSDLAEPTRGQFEKVQEELERLNRLCGRLLLLARLDQPGRDAHLLDERVHLENVVSELLDQMAPLAHDRGIALRHGALPAVQVRGSRPLLVEALMNLLDNGIRYTPRGGSVDVSISVQGGTVRVCVEDSGPGIPPGERERIFQRFYRIPRSNGTNDGSGLGLPIVQAIARAHGGRVELDQSPGGGSIFRLVLPARPGS